MGMGSSTDSSGQTPAVAANNAQQNKLTPQQQQAIQILVSQMGKQVPVSGSFMPMQQGNVPQTMAPQGGQYFNPQQQGRQ